MTQQKAYKEIMACLPGFYDGIEDVVDDIYSYFASKTCKNCTYNCRCAIQNEIEKISTGVAPSCNLFKIRGTL